MKGKGDSVKRRNLFATAILAIITSAIATAQPSIVSVAVPQPGQYGIEGLWNVTLNNPDQQTYEVWLEGAITDATKGQVFWAKTNEFQLQSGKKVIKYRDIQSIGIASQTHAPGYEQFAARTGGLPEGDYTFMVKLEPNFGSKSVKFDVAQRQPVRLITPRNGEVVRTPSPTFAWSLPSGERKTVDIDYVLGVKKVNRGQSAMQAWQTNRWHHVERSITQTSIQWPTSAPAFDSGCTYVWALKYYPRGKFKWPWPWPFPLPQNYVPFPPPDTFLFAAGSGAGVDTVVVGEFPVPSDAKEWDAVFSMERLGRDTRPLVLELTSLGRFNGRDDQLASRMRVSNDGKRAKLSVVFPGWQPESLAVAYYRRDSVVLTEIMPAEYAAGSWVGDAIRWLGVKLRINWHKTKVEIEQPDGTKITITQWEGSGEVGSIGGSMETPLGSTVLADSMLILTMGSANTFGGYSRAVVRASSNARVSCGDVRSNTGEFKTYTFGKDNLGNRRMRQLQ